MHLVYMVNHVRTSDEHRLKAVFVRTLHVFKNLSYSSIDDTMLILIRAECKVLPLHIICTSFSIDRIL